MALRRIVDSTAEPVSLTEMKDHVRVSSTADDAVLEGMIRAGREWMETNTSGRIAVDQRWRLTLDDFPTGDVIRLHRLPLNESTGSPVTVEYLKSTAAGTTNYTTFSSTNYIVDGESEPPRVVLKDDESWPDAVLANANAVRVEFTAGYGNRDDVPELYKLGVKMSGAHTYENREPVVVGSVATEVPKTLKTIKWALKVPEVP